MATTPPVRQYDAATPEDTIRAALAGLFPALAEDAHPTTLVFSGEGPTPEDAFEDALADIQDQAHTHGGAPVAVELEGWLRTDAGFRLWGTLGIDTQATSQEERRWDMTLAENEEGRWTLTMRNQ